MTIEHEQNVTLLDLREQVIAGRFKLLRRLRRGSYAEVWIAHNLLPKQGEPLTVAIKVLNAGLRGQIEPEMEAVLSENIRLEDYSLRRLVHPNIVKLYESGEDSDQRTGRRFYYIVLELLEGGDIYDLCHGHSLLLEQALLYVAQACSALAYAHQHGIIHRDIKPNNLLLTKDHHTLKALDFGTARVLDKQNGAITRVGTEIYAAPESYSPSGQMTLTATVDAYSLAKVLLFMLTGDSPAYLAQKQITLLPLGLMTEAWAPSLLSVLAKATCDEPRDRYQSVEEFHRALKQVLELTEVSTATPENRQRAWRCQYYPPPKHTRFEVLVRNGSVAAAAFPLNSFSRGSFINAVVGAGREALNSIPTALIMQIVAVVVLVAIVLIGVPQILPLLRHGAAPVVSADNKTDPLIGQDAQAITDLNIRSGPSADHPKIGLAEKRSRVRILSFNNDRTWYEIQVAEHGRAKTDPNSSDHGWVNRKYLVLN
ncbi:MAG TPA: serine/threonine protein kinase [Pyrinomonadaceae bacterium]|jgi:serine/threonine-protein kinase|nr:serine/threonine protein kinase [Pyrinomonadaceae bacterium]